MGCVQPADRYFLKITSFTQVLSFVSQAYYYPLYRRLIIILCITGLLLSSVSQAYSENPADFKPLTTEEMARIKAEKRQKDQVLQFFWGKRKLKLNFIFQAKKLKISENRKHLANVRVVQKNLVFVVGLSPRWSCSFAIFAILEILSLHSEILFFIFWNMCFRLADAEILRKPDYFGKFGKIHKVVINHSTQYAGSQLQVSCLLTSFSASINNISSESCTGAKC